GISPAHARARSTASGIPVPSASRSSWSWRRSRPERGRQIASAEPRCYSTWMALIAATQLRVGMIIMHQNDLWRVMNVVHVTPGNWRGMVQTKLRNLRAGTQTEYRFRSEDKPERVTLEQHDMEYLYESDGQYHFMNTENYEQIALVSDLLGDAVKYLIPNAHIQVEFHEGRPMGVSLPKTVDLKI